jgi:hypothetical protein
MAQLLLIKTDTAVAKAGDIVGVFPDEHVFTATEHAFFDIVPIKDTPREAIDILRPEVRQVVRSLKADWIFEQDLERKEVWKDADGNYKEIVERKKYPLAFKDGLFVNNYSADVKNQSVLVSAVAVDIKPILDEPIAKI